MMLSYCGLFGGLHSRANFGEEDPDLTLQELKTLVVIMHSYTLDIVAVVSASGK
jgi:hypothetical protein